MTDDEIEILRAWKHFGWGLFVTGFVFLFFPGGDMSRLLHVSAGLIFPTYTLPLWIYLLWG